MGADESTKEFVIAVVDGEAALCETLSNLLRPAGYGVQLSLRRMTFWRPRAGTAWTA